MRGRLGVVFGAGWFAAVPFVLFGAPERWQWLALVMGALVALILTAKDPA